MHPRFISCLPLIALFTPVAGAADTVAFWAFDEPVGMYPSSVLSDHGPNQYPLALGPGGSVVPGKFGRALATTPQPITDFPKGGVLFGLTQLATPAGRTVPPLSWMNAQFAALMTSGEEHLRKEFAYANATESGLNLGAFDWTVEFWFRADGRKGPAADGVVFEVGEGPRAENARITALRLKADRTGFVLVNQPAGVELDIASDPIALRKSDAWVHLAFVHEAAGQTLSHFVDGRPQGGPLPVRLKALAVGGEAYFSLGRDARWEQPLPGALDEMRFSRGRVYTGAFAPPGSLVADPNQGAPARKPHVTLPLLFAGEGPAGEPVPLGSRKHLLIDDALFPQHRNVTFVPTPPDRVELVYEVKGAMRKHVVVVDDEQGAVRIYSPVGKNDQLAVLVSRDGRNFEAPKLPDGSPDYPNLATAWSSGTPSVLIDPLAPPTERWKLVSGDDDHGIFLSTSADGFAWKRNRTAALSARSASQSNVFYDDQRGQYVGYHRTDIGENTFGKTERRFVLTLLDTLQTPWPFTPLTKADYDRMAAGVRLDEVRPWFFDNGPLTPGGLGIEYPFAFMPIDGFDPDATDIYVPKAVKYAGAPDVYLGFPCIYFHYEGTQPATRSVLGERDRGRGSGPIETQLIASRDGLKWTRYPRPVWHGVGLVEGWNIHQTYMAHGQVLRGDEIWMYSYNTEEYHSGRAGRPLRRGIFRTVQRLDRFVAAEAPYEKEAMLYSRPLTFTGRKLVMNADTGASGFIQVGILRGDGRPQAGYGVDDCVYVNGNELRHPVEWLGKGTDLSALVGEPVRLVIRMRGARLFSLQFTD